MRPVVTIARHDLKLTLTDRSAVMWMFVLPIAFATFFGLVMGGGSSTPQDPKARLTVVDADQSTVSRAFVAALESERLELVEISLEDRASTEDTIRTLVIPAGFEDKVLTGERVVVRLEKAPGSSAEAALVAQARITAAIARLIGQLVEASAHLPEGAELGAKALAAVAPSPDTVLVEAGFAGRAQVTPDGFSQSIPGNAVMFVMLVALTYGAASISSERQGGQLRRLATAPLTRAEIIAGKMAGRLVIAWSQVTAFVLVGAVAQLFVDLNLSNLFAVWVVLLIMALTVAPLGLILGGLFTDSDRAANVGVIVTVVMAGLGGCWWPLEVVSRPLQMLALAFPSGWAMKALHGVISFGYGLAEVTPALLVLLGFSAAFTFIATRTLRIE